MDGGSDQWPAIDGTSNHVWDRPKPLTGPPTSGSQNVVESTILTGRVLEGVDMMTCQMTCRNVTSDIR